MFKTGLGTTGHYEYFGAVSSTAVPLSLAFGFYAMPMDQCIKIMVVLPQPGTSGGQCPRLRRPQQPALRSTMARFVRQFQKIGQCLRERPAALNTIRQIGDIYTPFRRSAYTAVAINITLRRPVL